MRAALMRWGKGLRGWRCSDRYQLVAWSERAGGKRGERNYVRRHGWCASSTAARPPCPRSCLRTLAVCRVLKLTILLLAILLTCALQAVRVLKSRGMSTRQIKAMVLGWVGLEGKDEL